MVYLKVTNDGLIETEDLTLIGSSTKRGVEGKIGEFGSGNKFSLAWYFRNNCVPKVFRGTEEMKLDTKVVLHRDNPVKVLTVNGIDTSITSNMGPKWTGWMALRETISNALDEGNCTIKSLVNPDMIGEDGKTTYYIPMNSELERVISNFDHYFALERTPIFTNALGSMYERSSDCFNLYRQGIRCSDDNKEINFDVSLNNIEINESRLALESDFDKAMRDFITEGIDHRCMHLVLSSGYNDMKPRKFSASNLEVIKDMVASGKKFGSSLMQKLAGLMGTTTFDYVLPEYLYDQLVKAKIIDGITSDSQEDYIITDDSAKFPEIIYMLKAFNIDLPLKSVITTRFSIVRWEANRILINRDATSEGGYTNQYIAFSIMRNIASEYVTSKIK